MNRRYATYVRALGLLSLVIAVGFNSGCSKPSISLKQEVQAEFVLSGSEEVMVFKVTGNKSGELWKLYPIEKGVKLRDLGTIVYGSVPKLCRQETPKDGPPPALTEEEIYSAGAIIFDHEPVVIRFRMKNGKAIPAPE